jgi:hypothetical protein
MMGNIFSAGGSYDVSDFSDYSVDCNVRYGVGIVPHSGEVRAENTDNRATFLRQRTPDYAE